MSGYRERGDGMDTGREGMELIHGEKGWNGYMERGNGMDTCREWMNWIQGERG